MNSLRTPHPATLQNDAAVSTLTGVIVMVTLVVLLTVILSAFMVVVLPQKTAYIIADAQYSTRGGYPVITLFHRAGDTGHVGGSGEGYSLVVQVSAQGNTNTAVPLPASLRWSPGTTIYITRSGSGYIVTGDPARIPGTPLAFPGGGFTVSVIDTGTNGLVFEKRFTIPG